MAETSGSDSDDTVSSDSSSKKNSEVESIFDDSDRDPDYVQSRSESSDENTAANEQSPSRKRRKPNTPEKTTTSRWRQRNEQCNSRSKRKIRRNLGQPYVSDKTKKKLSGLELGSPCSCTKKCREKLQGSEINLFNEFWNLGSWELQNSYLFGCIDIVKEKRSYRKKQKHQESHRKGNAVYSVNVNGETTRKTEFLNVHELQPSKGRLNNIVRNKIEGNLVPKKDERGKHTNRLNKISELEIQSVKNHIDSIPKYQSHYSRQENINKVYLDHDMSIASLYSERYVPWCQEAGIEPVEEHTYRKIFCTQYNIGFKLPKSDTCKTCDEINIQIETAKSEKKDYTKLTTRLNLHKCKAPAMQLLKSETARSLTDKKTCVISFDLQQALPIPKLTTGPAFYCRKIWMYNLGIHDCTEDAGHMFVWTENIAKRGSDEVASILIKFLNSKIGDVEHLVFFTDNCPGQNKNWLLMSLWFHLVKEQKFKTEILLSSKSVIGSMLHLCTLLRSGKKLSKNLIKISPST